tara:strand:- start:103 stop:510 length:408 start_codon:yes stop_codon:yes gene_type:complete
MNKLVSQGKICPYCNSEPEFVDSSEVYGKSYGMIYLCRKCDAYVGVHKGTNKALGRLANKELRGYKKEAHKYFDNLWKRAIAQGRSKKDARKSAYKWLSVELEMHVDNTHIGMFDIMLCRRVIEICRPFFKEGVG